MRCHPVVLDPRTRRRSGRSDFAWRSQVRTDIEGTNRVSVAQVKSLRHARVRRLQIFRITY
jgi:hypothetical protein